MYPTEKDLHAWADQDRASSAIPQPLWEANVQLLDGLDALEYLLTDKLASLGGHAAQYVTKPVKRLLDFYGHLQAGIWCVREEVCAVPYAKPIAPRLDLHKLDKRIKYETGPGQRAEPITPGLVVDTLRAICAHHNLNFDKSLEVIWQKDLEIQKAHQSALTESLSTGQSTGSQTSQQPSYSRSDNSSLSKTNCQTSGDISQKQALNSQPNQAPENHFSASPVLPPLWQTWKTSGSTKLPKQAFWAWWQETNLPITITEGLKKALALLAHGVPAIAIRGITQWHLKGTLELHPELEQFATAGRQFHIIFDQDTKPKTIANVQQQACKLGTALEKKGCCVRVPFWSSELGKGIDDVLYGQGDSAQTWLDEILTDAPTLEAYRRSGRSAALLRFLARSTQTAFAIERDTEGEYLPELPELKPGIEVINATMNSGKTYRIGRDRVQAALAQGWRVIVLSPLNSLGQQTAKEFAIFHIHDQIGNPEAFWQAVQERPGLVLCPDSIGKIPTWFWQDQPLLLVIDEANQVTDHICKGDTFKSRYSSVLEYIRDAAKYAITSGGAIVLSEDGIPDRAIQFWQALTDTPDVRYFRHRKQGQPWPTTAYTGQLSGFRGRLAARLTNAAPLFFVSASQREGKRVERIARMFGRRVHRIDSETNENGAYRLFFSDPDKWLSIHQPEVLILSPSGKSGLSIQGQISSENAYFKDVWGYFPALDTDTHMQLLGRYRPAVPRHIYVSPFIVGDAEERLYRQKAIKDQLTENLKTMAHVFEARDSDRDLSAIEDATFEYLAESFAVKSAQKRIAQLALITRLESAGHEVRSMQLETDKAAADLWKTQQELIWAEESEQFAALEVLEGQTLDWALTTLDSLEGSYEDRRIARKVLWRDQFPGESFDDMEMCYEALFKDYGALRKGAQLQARAENLDAVRASDKAEAERLLSGAVRPGHRIPKNYIKAAMIAALGILELTEGTWSNGNARAIAVKQTALKYAAQINYYLRLQINERQTPSEICNKLIKKLGFAVAATARPGSGNSRDRLYGVTNLDNPFRQRLLEASRRKLAEASTTRIEEEKIAPIQIVDAPSINARVGQLVSWGSQQFFGLIEEIQGAIATVSDEVNELFRVPLSELAELH